MLLPRMARFKPDEALVIARSAYGGTKMPGVSWTKDRQDGGGDGRLFGDFKTMRALPVFRSLNSQ
jgi:hypothetical protein